MNIFEVIIAYSLHGLVYGMLLFLVSSGLSLVFGMMNVLSIAHAAFYMLGAYFAFSLVSWSGSFWISLIVAPIAVGVIGYIVERGFLRKVHIFGHAHELLITFGIFYVIVELVKLAWGDFPQPSPKPAELNQNVIFMGMEFSVYRFFILAVGIFVMGFMAYFLMKTRMGIILRSTVSDAEMVNMLGFNTERIFLYVFAVSSAMAGLGGVVAAPFLVVSPGMAMDMMIDMFIVVVVGGFGSLLGAFVASIMLAELQSFGILLIPQLAMVLQFLLMAVVLIIRPTGLFGEKT